MSHRVHLWQFPYDALLERYMTSTAHYTRVLERTSERDGDTFEMRDAGDGVSEPAFPSSRRARKRSG